MNFELHPIPRWTDAASALVTGLVRLPDAATRLTLLERVCRSLGDELYPAFLQMLCVIEASGDRQVQRSVSTTLVDCLVSGRLPSGRLPSWGAARAPADGGPTSTLGPLEFVCAWYGQPSSLAPLPKDRFDEVLRALIALVSTHRPAAALYAAKLADDAEDPVLGSLSGSTRNGIEGLAARWRAALQSDAGGPNGGDGTMLDASAIVEAFHTASTPEDLLGSIARGAPPELQR